MRHSTFILLVSKVRVETKKFYKNQRNSLKSKCNVYPELCLGTLVRFQSTAERVAFSNGSPTNPSSSCTRLWQVARTLFYKKHWYITLISALDCGSLPEPYIIENIGTLPTHLKQAIADCQNLTIYKILVHHQTS